MSKLKLRAMVFIVIILSGASSKAADKDGLLDFDDGYRFLWEMYGDETKPPGAAGDFIGDWSNEDFLFFLAAGPIDGFGHYAVNRRTGDVWERWACKKHTSALLRKSQEKIRRQYFKGKNKEYHRLRRLRPICYNE